MVWGAYLFLNHSSPGFAGRSSRKSSGIDFDRDDFQLCERAIRSRVTPRKAGQVEPPGGKRLNNLARRDIGLSRDGVNTEFAFFEKLLVGHRLTKLATSSSTEIVEQSFRKSSNFPVAEPPRPATAATPAFGSNAEAFSRALAAASASTTSATRRAASDRSPALCR